MKVNVETALAEEERDTEKESWKERQTEEEKNEKGRKSEERERVG